LFFEVSVMKIQINRIPQAGGLNLDEVWNAKTSDLDTGSVKFTSPINIAVYAEKGYNNVTLFVKLSATIELVCGRCLESYMFSLNKDFKLYYTLERNQNDLNPDVEIRQEIILTYPVKALCSKDCKGLCSGCGKDLNKEKCICKK